MEQGEIPISCRVIYWSCLTFNSASSGGLVSSGFHRDIYTNGFLDTLRTPRKPQTPIERWRSSWKTKKEKADYYMRTQTYTSAKQREASNTFRKYQLKR